MRNRPLMIAKCLIFCLIMAQIQSFSQSEDPPLRVEIPVGSTNETYRTLPMGKAGMILYYRSVETAGPGLINWYFSLYDTNLLQQWTLPVGIPANHQISSIRTHGTKAYLLYSASEKERQNDPGIEVVTIDIATSKMTLSSGKAVAGGDLAGFEISEPYAWIGINSNERYGRLYQLDLVSGTLRQILTGLAANLSLFGFQISGEGDGLTALFSIYVSKKQISYSLVSISPDGNITQEFPLLFPKPGILITECRFAATGEKSSLILGTYAESLTKTNRPGRNKPATTGLFSCEVNDGIPEAVKTYHYTDLISADKLVGKNEIIQLKKKALKKNRDIHEFSLDYQVVMSDIKPVGDIFLLTLEIFDPQYHSETFTDFDFYGRPYSNSYNVFDGYLFSQAIVAGFNTRGELQWDNHISFRNLLTMELVPKLMVHPVKQDELVLLYLSEGTIGSGIIKGTLETAPVEYSPLALMWPEDKLIAETKGKIMNWHGNYFLAGGYQEIKNIGMNTPGKRLVFYFSKVEYNP